MTQTIKPASNLSARNLSNPNLSDRNPSDHAPSEQASGQFALGQAEALLAQLLAAAQQQNRLLERIAVAVEAGDGSNASPNYEVCLTQFRAFDWGAIEATVEQEDRDGVATVLWRGHRYVRRSAANKFEPAIWFSRAQGKDEAGNTQYARLVTFKLRPSVEPLPSKVKEVQTSK